MLVQLLTAALIVWLVLAFTTSGALAKGFKMTPELLLAYRNLITVTQEADNRMFEQMQKAVNMLKTESENDGSFPQGNELLATLDQLNRCLKDNPYLPPPASPDDSMPTTGMPMASPSFSLESKPLPPPVVPRVKVWIDGDIQPGLIDSLLESPPSDWEADPGSIVVITNTQNFMIAWGAGSNRKPICDEQGKPRLAITSFHLQ